VVAIAGGIIFVRPAIVQVGPNILALAEKQAEYDKFVEDYGDAAFKKIGTDIMTAHERVVDASKAFHEVEYRDFEVDRLVREILSDVDSPEIANLPLNNLLIYRVGTSPLALSLHTPNEVAYPIKDLATIEASDLKQVEEGGTLESMQRRLAGASRNQAMRLYLEWIADTDYDNADVVVAMREFLSGEQEAVATQIVKFMIPLNQTEADALSMHVFGLELATHIRSMERGDSFGGSNAVAGAVADGDDDAGGDDTDGDGGGASVPNIPDPSGRFMYTVEMVFYIVEPMQEPSDEDFKYLSFS
jgi:hypothetical protein